MEQGALRQGPLYILREAVKIRVNRVAVTKSKPMKQV